uniref:IlGF domain-containing protein n=2 Tax=Caenorhabditis tropicalis TaxID=1561998 RepID=A0A1I7UA67_9PELO
MNLLPTLIFLFTIGIVTGSLRHFDSSSVENNIRFLHDLQMEMQLDKSLDKPMSRVRRVPAPGDARACGRKLVLYVLTVCEDSCNPKHGKDIATLCCAQQCSEELIKEACCPSS